MMGFLWTFHNTISVRDALAKMDISRWVGLKKLIAWKNEAAQSHCYAAWRYYLSRIPWWRKPFHLILIGVFLLGITSALSPLLTASALASSCLLALFLGGFIICLFVIWAVSKARWWRFVVWLRKNDPALPHDLSSAQIVGPSFLITSMRLEIYAALFLIVGAIALQTGYPPKSSANSSVWIMGALLCCLFLPVFPALSCLLDSTYWWAFGRGLAAVWRFLSALAVLIVFCVAYLVGVYLWFACSPEGGATTFGVFAALFLPVFGFGFWVLLCWWFALWISEIILSQVEGSIAVIYQSQTLE